MRVAIVGACAAGLAAAYDLTRGGHEVVIYEGGDSVGGLAAGFKAPHWDWTLEKFYHHWFASDSAMLGLIDELGWKDDVIFERPYTVIYNDDDGSFEPFDSPLIILKSLAKRFGVVAALRFALVGLYLRLTPRWQPLEKVTADAWMRRACGDRVYEALWKPLLVGKFGEENLGVVNMAWLWARLHSRTTRLGTFRGGFQGFLDRFAEVVRRQGAEMRLGTGVTAIRPLTTNAGGIRIDVTAGVGKPLPNPVPAGATGQEGTSSGDSSAAAPLGMTRGRLAVTAGDAVETYDAVISTTSPAAMSHLAPELPEEYCGRLQKLQSMGAVVVVLSLDRQLTPYYWHSLPKDAGFPFLALVEHTNFMDASHYDGDRLVYIGDYLPQGHEYFSMTKEQLVGQFLPSLTRFNPDFDASWIKESWLFKTAYAQPVPPVGHSQNLPPLKTPIPGLYFASMSQVYPWDRGTNFAIEMGRRVAGMVAAESA